MLGFSGWDPTEYKYSRKLLPWMLKNSRGASRSAVQTQTCYDAAASVVADSLFTSACIVVALQTAPDKARLVLESWRHVFFSYCFVACRHRTCSVIDVPLDVKPALIQRHLYFRQQLLETERTQKHKGPICSALCSN